MKEVVVGSTLISKDRKFLLVKAKKGAAKGLWNTPGGGADEGESFEDCATRETFEETGYKIKLGRLIGTFHFEALGDKVTKKIFEATVIDGELNPPEDEIEEARWFSNEELKNELDFTFGSIKSIQDFISKEFGRVYYPDRIA